MYDVRIKHKAIKMRESGRSLNEIVNLLRMNKSTVAYWCRAIELKESAIQKIKTKGRKKSVQALLRYSENKRRERIERDRVQKKSGGDMVGSVSRRDVLLAGFGLYWGEGYKQGELGFTNSNSKIIQFYIAWLRLFNVSKSDLIFRLTINQIFKPHQKKITDFWVDLLEVGVDQFSKTTLIKTKLKKAFLKNNQTYNGILRVKVRRGFALKNKILGAIDHISVVSQRL